jgi:sugar phosphate isomerase/epimerase
MDPNRLAAQMYTLRDFIKTPEGLRDALQRVSEMGYKGVQMSAVGAFDIGLTAAQARKWLDEFGLKCMATHRPWKRYTEALDEEIVFHQTLGCDYAGLGSFTGLYGVTPDDYRRFVADLAPIIAKLKSVGIRFGVHNHAVEFMKFDGLHPFDVLIDEGGPDIQLLIDTYWVHEAGVDVIPLIQRCAGRVAVLHLKDREVTKEGTRMGAVGEGNLPWAEIVRAADAAGAEWYAVEQDVCPRDPFDCLKSSFEYLSELDAG